jgi:hypothetical protein
MRHISICHIFIFVCLLAARRGVAAPTADNPATQPAVPVKPSDRLDSVKPDPSLGADAVVRIVMSALQQNDANDNGIEITFRFASPGNKQITGPLDHFKQLVKSPGYAPMLGCKSVEYGKIRIEGDNAVQGVRIIDATGAALVYIFQLSKQANGEFKGCWMTDGVVRFDPGAQPAAPKEDDGGTVKT